MTPRQRARWALFAAGARATRVRAIARAECVVKNPCARSRARGGAAAPRARDAACGLGVVKGVSWSVFLCILMGVAQVTAFIRTRGVDSRANKMPVSRGVHTPHVEYVPSSEFAWGSKGEW